MYTIKKMYSDLGHDFSRYRDYSGCKTGFKYIKNIYILLKSPSFFAIINHRFGFWINSHFFGQKSIFKHFLKLFYFIGKYLSVCISKIDIDVSSEIGEGLFLSNRGNIILGVDRMGRNCTVDHNVTIGNDQNRLVPTISDNVWIGSNSVIYGRITIGENTVITESSVLSKSLPGRVLAGGNPCRIIKNDKILVAPQF
jgi:serine O-acetyltransferase